MNSIFPLLQRTPVDMMPRSRASSDRATFRDLGTVAQSWRFASTMLTLLRQNPTPNWLIRRRAFGWAMAIAWSTLFAAGCNGGKDKLYPVRGKLMFKNEPMAGAIVYFHLEGSRDVNKQVPYGTADANGEFQLMTYPAGEGAPAGEYVVTIIWPGKATGGRETGGRSEEAPDRLNKKYATPGPQSPKVTVRPEPNQLQTINLS